MIKNVRTQKSSLLFFLIYLIIPIGAFSFVLNVYWPGLISPDSVYQWEMARGISPFNQIIPVGYTFLIRVLISVWNSPEIVPIFQLLFLSSAFAFCMLVLDRRGVKRIFLLLATLFFALAPCNMVLSITTVSYTHLTLPTNREV